jgi:hypothetical protein
MSYQHTAEDLEESLEQFKHHYFICENLLELVLSQFYN